MKATLKFFEGVGVTLTPAGRWRFKTGHKKEAIDPNRVNYLEWASFPDDNMAKYSIQDTPYIIIDIDGDVDDDFVRMFPSVQKTLVTTTTAMNKKHCYFYPPKSVEGKQLFRLIGFVPNVDILSTGILFEGHGKSMQGNPTGCYHIKDLPIATLTDKEWGSITEGIKNPKVNAVQNQKLHFNSAIAKTAIRFVEGEKLTVKQFNTLFGGLQLTKANDNPRKRAEIVPLSYDSFNRACFILFNNSAIDTKTAEKFAKLVLASMYDIDPDSDKSRQMLYKQIFPSLPQHGSVMDMNTEHDLKERLDSIALADKTFVKFVNAKGAMDYLVLDPDSYKPIRLATDSLSYQAVTIRNILRLKLPQWEEYEATIPLVKLVNTPYRDLMYFDELNYIDCYNISQRTKYQEEAVECNNISDDNVLNKVIKSYMGKHADFYYAWLAQVIFGDVPPNTILLCVSSPDAPAGTGKTTLASSIPYNLTYNALGVTEADISAGWGNYYIGKRLLTINDARSPDLWSDTIYPTMRDETTSGQRKARNTKYGGIIEASDSIAFAMSANYIPPIDPHDRRCAFFTPAFLDGGSTSLSTSDSDYLNKLIEHTPLTTFKPEFQELANHLLWWYKQDRFKRELRVEAPRTKGRDIALATGKGYGRLLLGIISSRPSELELMLNANVRGVASLYPLKGEEIKTFLQMAYKYSYNESKGTINLPIEFLGNMLALVQNNAKTTPLAILTALGSTPNKLYKAKGATDTEAYWHYNFSEYRLPPTMVKWKSQQIFPLKLEKEAVEFYSVNN